MSGLTEEEKELEKIVDTIRGQHTLQAIKTLQGHWSTRSTQITLHRIPTLINQIQYNGKARKKRAT